MPIYFKTRDPEAYMIYMGKDKFENEELIAYGFEEDIWFHVDDLSSAHVYLRLPKGKTIHTIPEAALEDCCQLVKQNSIQGCKLPSVKIVYTPWSNLKKTQGMDVGQVGFKDEALVLKYTVQKKLPAVLNRIMKTKEEREVDVKALWEKRQNDLRQNERKLREEQRLKEKEEIEKNKEMKELKSYKGFMDEEKMTSNQTGNNAEDDFW